MILHTAAEIFKCFSKNRNFLWGYKENKWRHFSKKKDWRNIARDQGKDEVAHDQQESRTTAFFLLVLTVYGTIRTDPVCRFKSRLYSNLQFSHANIFLICGSCCKQFFLCFRLPANNFFTYLHTIYFSVYGLCKQFISKFSNPSPRPNKKWRKIHITA